MTNRVQLRYSTTPSVVPTIAQLLTAELGINLVDKKLYVNDGSAIYEISHAENITTDSTHRFVTDAQIAAWSAAQAIASDTVLGSVIIGDHIQVQLDGTISILEANGSQAGVLTAADWTTFNNKQAALGYTPVNRAGDTMTGLLTLSADPTNNFHATTKQYTDAADALKLNLSGGTMTGLLVLSGDPVAGLGAATKQYVDGLVDAVSGSYAAPVQTLADLSAILPAAREDKQIRLVENAGALFRYDDQSTDTADGVGVIIPDDTPATGRWIKVQAATQNHNTLTNLQGGASNDYLHLTTAEKNSYDSHLTDDTRHLTSSQNTWIDAITASSAEVNYLVGVTSSIQSQIDGKQDALGYTPVNVAGDTMLGHLVLFADPTLALHPVTRQYLENYVINCGTF